MKTIRARLFCLLALLVLSSTQLFGSPRRDFVRRRVADEVAEKGEARVIVALSDDKLPQARAFDWHKRIPAIANMRARVMAGAPRFRVRRTYEIEPLLAGTVDAEALKQLEASPIVAGVYPDRTLHAVLNQSGPLIGAPQAQVGGFTGHGMSIAIIDTGIDYKHSDFGGTASSTLPTGKVVGGYDFVNDDSDPMDDNGHGTHVAGIAAGTDAVYRGIAPYATLMAYKVIDPSGSALVSDVLAALDRAIQDQATYNIKVINLSLSDGQEWTSDEEFRTQYGFEATVYDDAVNHGMVVVAAAGNDGYLGGIASPAIISSVISVGATYDATQSSTITYPDPNGCVDTRPVVDSPACFSDRGELIDVYAPGALITSAYASTSVSAPQAGDPPGFTTEAGTSAASPHAAAAAACVINMLASEGALPSGIALSAAVRQRLKKTGILVLDHATSVATPRIDLARAMHPITTGPDLVVTAVSTTAAFAFQGDSIVVGVTVRNQGNAASAACTTEIVLSANTVISPQDYVVAKVPIPILTAGQTYGPVAVTGTVPTIVAGIYHLGAFADSSYYVAETDKTNNSRLGPDITISASSVVQSSNLPAFMVKGQSSPVSVTMFNEGPVAWSAADGYALLPVSPIGNSNWGLTQVPIPGGATIAPGQSVTFSFNVTAPITAAWIPCHWQMANSGRVFGETATGATKTLVADDPNDGQDYPSISADRVAYEDYRYNGVSVTDLNTMNTVSLPDDIPFPADKTGNVLPPFQYTLLSAQGLPSLSGPWVAWMTDDVPDPQVQGLWYVQILAYNLDAPGSLPVRLNYNPNQPSEQWEPSVDGNLLAYVDFRNDSDRVYTGDNTDNAGIYIADLSAAPDANHTVPTYPLTTAPGMQQAPRISGNLVVWEDYRTGEADIWMYDLSLDSNGTVDDRGNPVPNWKQPPGTRPNPDPAEIRLTSTSYPELYPDVSGRTVVWLDLRRNPTVSHVLYGSYPYADIYALDVDTMTQTPVVTDPLTYRDAPRIDGRKVVWPDTRFGQFDVFWQDLDSGVTADVGGSLADEYPADISGRRIAYSQWVTYNQQTGTNVYNIMTQQMLTNGSVGVHTFTDVQNDQWAWEWIEAVAAHGVSVGYRDSQNLPYYSPDAVVTRDQMAVYIARAHAGGDADVTNSPDAGFTDMTGPDEAWAVKYVNYCVHNSIVQGYTDPATQVKTYKPADPVNRGAMAVFVARAVAGGDGNVPDATAQDFSDVTPTGDWEWAYKYIEYCVAHGVVQGYIDPVTHVKTYRPGDPVNRGAMAVYVSRAFKYTPD